MKAETLLLLASVMLFVGCTSPSPARSHVLPEKPHVTASSDREKTFTSARAGSDLEIIELFDALIGVFGGNTTKTTTSTGPAPQESATLQTTFAHSPE